MHTLSGLFWPRFLPRRVSRRTLIDSPSGEMSSWECCSVIWQKSCLFSQKQAGITSRPRRFCEGFFWGWLEECSTRSWERRRGEFSGESFDFRDFSAIVLTIPKPPKEKKWEDWRGLCLGVRTKKEPRKRIPGPLLRVLFEWKHVQDWNDENISARWNSYSVIIAQW